MQLLWSPLQKCVWPRLAWRCSLLEGNRTPRTNIDLIKILGVSEWSPMSTPDFFRSRLDAMVDLRHPLAVLATKMSWASIETTLAPLFERRSRDGRVSEAVDLFGSNSLELAGGVSAAGRPRLPMRLMVGLLYLKHAYNESDETVCERWAQDVYFQFFCGEEYFQPHLPCDPTNLVRFRQALGEAGVEELLAATIAAGVQMKAVTPVEFERVMVDTTVQGIRQHNPLGQFSRLNVDDLSQ